MRDVQGLAVRTCSMGSRTVGPKVWPLQRRESERSYTEKRRSPVSPKRCALSVESPPEGYKVKLPPPCESRRQSASMDDAMMDRAENEGGVPNTLKLELLSLLQAEKFLASALLLVSMSTEPRASASGSGRLVPLGLSSVRPSKSAVLIFLSRPGYVNQTWAC
jgi:hypothetical protein